MYISGRYRALGCEHILHLLHPHVVRDMLPLPEGEVHRVGRRDVDGAQLDARCETGLFCFAQSQSRRRPSVIIVGFQLTTILLVGPYRRKLFGKMVRSKKVGSTSAGELSSVGHRRSSQVPVSIPNKTDTVTTITPVSVS